MFGKRQDLKKYFAGDLKSDSIKVGEELAQAALTAEIMVLRACCKDGHRIRLNKYEINQQQIRNISLYECHLIHRIGE